MVKNEYMQKIGRKAAPYILIPVLALGLNSDNTILYSPAPTPPQVYENLSPTNSSFEEALRNIVNEPPSGLETAITINRGEENRGIFLNLDGEQVRIGPGFTKNLGYKTD